LRALHKGGDMATLIVICAIAAAGIAVSIWLRLRRRRRTGREGDMFNDPGNGE